MSLTIEVPTTIMGIYDEEFEGPLTPLSSDDEDQENQKDSGLSIPQNLEDGEIFEEKVTTKATLGRKKRRLLKKINIQKRRELDQQRQNYMHRVLSQIYGDDVFIHHLTKSDEYFQKICNLETVTGSPVSVDDPEFPKEQTLWINKPGLHLGVDAKDASLIFAVRVRPFHTIKPLKKAEIIDCLTTVMDWTTCVSDIKLNASQKKPHGNEASKPSEPTTERKRNGVMFGAGWHQSMEADKTIVYYAPKTTKAAPGIYERCIENFSRVARLYRDGLCAIFPAGAGQIDNYAMENMVPSFATLTLDGNSAEAPFANSLTITRDDFSNYQHKDADKIQIAYGLWWPAALHKAGHHKQYVINSNIGQDKVKGGAFLWGEYGVAVEFEKCDGLVEIYWRGKLDFHCTTASRSAANTTRFGTSVQLTGKGTAAVARYWASGGDVTQSTTPEDRLIAVAAALQDRAQKPSKGKGKA